MAIRIRARVRPGLPGCPAGLRPFLGAATFSFLPVQPPRAGYAPERPRSDVGTCPRRNRHGPCGARDRPATAARLGRDYFASASPSFLASLDSASALASSVLSAASASGFLPRSILAVASGASSDVGQRGGVVRDDRAVGSASSVVVAVDDAVVLLVREDRADRVLRVGSVDAGRDLQEDRVLVDLLDGGVHAPDRADAACRAACRCASAPPPAASSWRTGSSGTWPR